MILARGNPVLLSSRFAYRTEKCVLCARARACVCVCVLEGGGAWGSSDLSSDFLSTKPSFFSHQRQQQQQRWRKLLDQRRIARGLPTSTGPDVRVCVCVCACTLSGRRTTTSLSVDAVPFSSSCNIYWDVSGKYWSFSRFLEWSATTHTHTHTHSAIIHTHTHTHTVILYIYRHTTVCDHTIFPVEAVYKRCLIVQYGTVSVALGLLACFPSLTSVILS